MLRLEKRAGSQRGVATAELAFLLPVLLVAALGLVDFGRAAYEAMDLDGAANAGASYAVRSPSAALNTTAIRNAAIAGMGTDFDASKVAIDSARTCECADGSTVDCTTSCGGSSPRMFVRVRASKTFHTLFSYPGVPKQIALAREVQFRVR